jgi:hypothetical protein
MLVMITTAGVQPAKCRCGPDISNVGYCSTSSYLTKCSYCTTSNPGNAGVSPGVPNAYYDVYNDDGVNYPTYNPTYNPTCPPNNSGPYDNVYYGNCSYLCSDTDNPAFSSVCTTCCN